MKNPAVLQPRLQPWLALFYCGGCQCFADSHIWFGW